MNNGMAENIVDAVAQELSQFGFDQRHANVTDDIAGLVKKPPNFLQRIFGGHGMAAVVVVPESVTGREELKVFFRKMRKDLNSRFVGFAAYKSAHSFIVLLCSGNLFATCSDMASKLKDRTGLHKNIIQGVILVDTETREVTGDYTRPAQHKREYEAVLSAATSAAKQETRPLEKPDA